MESSKGNLNLKAAFLHNLSDAGFSVAVLVGGLVVMQTGLVWIDPALTLVLAVLMVVPALGYLKQSARILMLGAPPEIKLDDVRNTLLQIEGVEDVHHLDLWQIDEHTTSVEAHVGVGGVSRDSMQRIIAQARQCVLEFHDIGHGTFQLELERADCEAAECG